MKMQIYLALGLLFPVALLTAEIYAPCVCKGSAIKLFSNTILNPLEGYVSLYRNDALINRWYAYTNDDYENIKEEKSKKRIVRDGKYDIWLHGWEEIDNGLYKVVYSLEANSHTSREKKMDGTLNICIPPYSDCKPSIQRIQKQGEIISLKATLRETGCGMPPVTVYWLGSNSTNSILEIKSTEEPRSYFACTTGPAMRCLSDDLPHRDYCSEKIINKYDDLDAEKAKSDEAKKIDTIYWAGVCMLVVTCAHLIIRMLSFIPGFCKKYRSRSQRSIHKQMDNLER